MVIAIIQARMGSTRLPGKVLMEVRGKPVIWHVVNRVGKSKFIDKVAIATSTSESDKKLEAFCKDNNIPCFTGSENDVLDRYYKAALSFGAAKDDTIIRITGDCPLIDPDVIDKVIGLYFSSEVDYASNVNPPTYPDGLDAEVFKFEALEQAWKDAGLSSEREHVTPYIRNHTELFKQANLLSDIDYSHMRWTLDEKEDFTLIDEIYKGLDKKGGLFNMDEILRFLNSHTDITKVNSSFKRNEGYAKSLLNDTIKKQERQ